MSTSDLDWRVHILEIEMTGYMDWILGFERKDFNVDFFRLLARVINLWIMALLIREQVKV